MNSICRKYCFGILLVLLFCSCKDELHTIPPLTHEGRNVLGYFDYTGDVVGGKTSTYFDDQDRLVIRHYDQDDFFTGIKHEWDLRIFLVQDTTTMAFVLDSIYCMHNSTEMFTDSLGFPTFAITHHDPVRKILCGVFELDYIYDYYDSDTISITKGRFDVIYP